MYCLLPFLSSVAFYQQPQSNRQTIFYWLLLLLTAITTASATTTHSSTTFHLDGTPHSYLQFASWQHFFSKSPTSSKLTSSPLDPTFSFEFRCATSPSTVATAAAATSIEGPNTQSFGGLLLYADDYISSSAGGVFLEVKLLSESHLRVRIDDAGAVRTRNIIELQAAINFTDGQWHRFELTRHLGHRPSPPPTQLQLDLLEYAADDGEDQPQLLVESITVKVDSEAIHKKIELSKSLSTDANGGDNSKGHSTSSHHHHGRSVFIGGLPHDYQKHYLAQLALPTVAYERHFRGSVRNVLYAAASSSPGTHQHHQHQKEDAADLRMQLPIAKGGLLSDEEASERSTDTECPATEQRCHHGGHCLPTQSGPYCDCSATDFEGPFCQKERHIFEATFRGNLGEYLGYNPAGLPQAWSFVSTTESFELTFRTKLANGLLLLTAGDEDEHDEDHLILALRDAGISLNIRLGSVVHQKTVKPSKVRFDDNEWHTVVVERKIREISPSTFFCHFSITVDGIYTQHGSTAGTIPYFISKVFYVGGIVHNSIAGVAPTESSTATATAAVQGSSNFVGCLRKIVYSADNVRLDLLTLVHDQHSSPATVAATSLIRFYGGEHQHSGTSPRLSSPMMCHDVDASDPITFTTEDSYLRVAQGLWDSSSKDGSLSLRVRTNEPNGVLLYSAGAAARGARNSSAVAQHDFFALELLDGELYLLLHLGSTPVKVKASTKRIDDSHWHSIVVSRSGRTGQIVVDDTEVSDFISPGTATHLDLADELYLGGFPRFTGDRLTYIPPQLWSAAFGYGYVGCVRDLIINGRTVDIAALAKRQDSGGVKPSCHSSAPQCSAETCQNGGTCTEGWNRYSCQCSHTPFTGSVCAKNAATLSFNGEQYLSISLPEELRTQTESVYIRFRTTKQNGLLLSTTSHLGAISSTAVESHYLTLILEAGSVRVDLAYGEGGRAAMDRIAQIGAGLGDDKWHTIHLERRGHNLVLVLDQTQRVEAELTGQHATLHVDTIHVGAKINTHKGPHLKHYPGFVGYMQNFIYNGQPYFEKARDGQLASGSIRMTAKLGKKDRILHNVATFKSKYTFVGLPQLRAYTQLNIYFQFKTREPNGLILFNGGGQRHDFIAVELVNGHLEYVFDLGDGPRRLQSKARTTLNDNRWHTVTLGRPSLHHHTMLIDDSLMTTSTSASTDRNLHLDLEGLFYFGGVRDSMWSGLPKAIKSRAGYEGCIASLDLNGETFNLVGSDVLIPSTLVEAGCSAPLARCSSTACANRGICVQLWNSYTCDCDLTTYSGPTCADGNESTAYQFGPGPGLVTFTFDENNRPDTRNDLLALGFLTSQKNGALVRIDSGTTADYLQLELIDGNVLVVFNLGTEDIDIGELGIKVNDGKYHIVRFTRSGQNSTLQIDNHNVLTRSPSGKQMNIFNSHAKIEIGGHKNVLRSAIEKPFVGIIAGLVFNGHRLLDMAAEDDPRMRVEGDVELMISIAGNQDTVLTTPLSADRLNNQMLSEPKSSSPNSDDLIYSGAGSGCFDVNDDEECSHVAHEGSGDELITPVYKAVNRLRPTTPSSSSRGRGRPGAGRGKPCQNNDDDDECVGEGSGGYEPEAYPHPPPPPSSNHSSSMYDSNYYYSTSSPPRSWTTWMPPTVAPMNRPPLYPTPPPFYTYGGRGGGEYGPEYGGPEQLYPMRPKTTAPSWTKPIYSVSGPTRPIVHNQPIEPQGPPEIFDVPLNIPPIANDSIPEQLPPIPEVLSRSSNERTAVIIGAIILCLIGIVIIAPVVIYFKVIKPPPSYKETMETAFGGGGVGVGGMGGLMMGGKGFGTMPLHGGAYPQFSPVVRATSVSGITGHPGLGPLGPGGIPMLPPPPGASLGRGGAGISRPGTRPGTPTDLMSKKKDPHEWYV